MSTIQRLVTYRRALEDWKRRGGLDGGGGNYDHKLHKYMPCAEPSPDVFNLTCDPVVQKMAKMIRAEVLP